jgi:NADH-quinone oxidoreductase subunit L
MTENLHLWIIPLLPLAGAAINGLLGKRFSRNMVATVALTFCGGAFAWALWIASRFASLETLPHVEMVATWLRSGSFQADYGFALDQLSMVMLLVVTGVGFLIHIYSVGYMWEEGGFYRFFSYLNLFMFFMLTLVLASNYLLMFVGWEGVGLASYLLIGFYFTRDSAAAAGKKAFIVNRVGDFGFLIALFLIIQHFGTLDFSKLFEAVKPYSPETSGTGLLTAIALLLMVGACGKSAQIPLYVWLPDAMEGPTPVSALIHAAYGILCRDHRHCADGHQEGAGLLNHLPAGIHVSGLRRGGVFGRHISPDDARVLQGPVVSCGGFRDSRHRRRAGHAQDGRLAQANPLDFLDDDCGHVCDRWNSAAGRFFQQG